MLHTSPLLTPATPTSLTHAGAATHSHTHEPRSVSTATSQLPSSKEPTFLQAHTGTHTADIWSPTTSYSVHMAKPILSHPLCNIFYTTYNRLKITAKYSRSSNSSRQGGQLPNLTHLIWIRLTDSRPAELTPFLNIEICWCINIKPVLAEEKLHRHQIKLKSKEKSQVRFDGGKKRD